MKELITKLNIPYELKRFLLKDIDRIKPIINGDLLLEMEYLYQYYSILFNVSDKQYSTSVIVFLSEQNKLSSLNNLLKVAFSEQEPSNIMKLLKMKRKQEEFEMLFEKTKIEYIELAQEVKEKTKNTGVEDIYKLIGKMELVSELNQDNYYTRVSKLGIDLIEKHLRVK